MSDAAQHAVTVADGDGRVEVFGPYRRASAARVAEWMQEAFEDAGPNVAPGLRVEVVLIREPNTFKVEDYVF